MKKSFFITFTAILFIGCSKNDDNTNNTPTITGKWYFKETVVNGTTYPYDDHETCGKDYLEFYGTNGVKSIDIFGCEVDVDWTGTYTLNGSILTITNANVNETIICEVLELTSNSLIYKFNYDTNGDGTPETNISKFDR